MVLSMVDEKTWLSQAKDFFGLWMEARQAFCNCDSTCTYI